MTRRIWLWKLLLAPTDTVLRFMTKYTAAMAWVEPTPSTSGGFGPEVVELS